MTLYAWPPQTLVNRVIPKSKVYAHTKLTAALRRAFVADVRLITWRAKLAPETVHLAATDAVPEIQVIEIALRTRDIREDVLAAADRAIPFPILFELTYAGDVRMAATWKRPGPTADRWVLSHYLVTPWMPGDSPRKGLPVAIDLGGLYQQLLSTMAPHPPRSGESLADYFDRLRVIRSLERDQERLEKQLAREKQFNRKVEINAQVRAVRKEIALLTDVGRHEPPSNELKEASN